jgi:uncharacterized protein (TIGR00269 family)
MLSTCTMCKRRDAIYKRPYSGEKLCVTCFCHSLEDKVRVTIAKHDMLSFDDKIAIGVSGGKDSMALLSILVKLEKSFPKAGLIAVTVDEGISGYRDEALNIAEKSCQKLAVEHVVVSFKELFGFEFDELAKSLMTKDPNIEHLTPCAYCGVLRRRALNNAARICGATKLATGHNLDDETQTILLNVFHGDPLRIARVKPISSATHPNFVPRIKPLCEVLEKESTLYAYLRKIKFQSLPCPYSYTASRNDIRTMLNRMEEKHAGLKYTIYRSIEKLRDCIEGAPPAAELRNCKLCGEPTVHEVCQVCKLLENFKLH